MTETQSRSNIEDIKIPHQSDRTPGTTKQRDIESDAKLIFFGDAADLPDGSTHEKAYFEEDTNKFKCWNGTAWVEIQLTS